MAEIRVRISYIVYFYSEKLPIELYSLRLHISQSVTQFHVTTLHQRLQPCNL